MQVKLLLVTLFEWQIACSTGKPSERMSKFWTVRFLKNRISVFRTSLKLTLCSFRPSMNGDNISPVNTANSCLTR